MEMLLLLVLLLCACINMSGACSCFPESGPGRFCGYDLIFRGMAVAEYEEREEPINHSDPYWRFSPFSDRVYTVRVDQAIVMPDDLKEATNITLRTPTQGSLCGVHFLLDVDAVFFARVNSEEEIETGLCDPNVPWALLSEWERELTTQHIVDYCATRDRNETMPPEP